MMNVLQELENEDEKDTVRLIINELEKNSHLTLDEIKNIVTSSGLSTDTSGWIYTENTSGTHRGKGLLILRFHFCGPALLWLITLNKGGWVRIGIGGKTIYGPKSINMKLFIGHARCNPGEPFTSGDEHIYVINGVGFLIS